MFTTIITPDHVRAEAELANRAADLQLAEIQSGEGLTQTLRQSAGEALVSLGNWVKPRNTSLPLGRPNWAGR